MIIFSAYLAWFAGQAVGLYPLAALPISPS
jgi:hypothetical protein